MEVRWSKDGGQGCTCVGTAGLWGISKTRVVSVMKEAVKMGRMCYITCVHCGILISYVSSLTYTLHKILEATVACMVGAYPFTRPLCVSFLKSVTAPLAIWVMTWSRSYDFLRRSDLVLLRRFFHFVKSWHKHEPKNSCIWPLNINVMPI